mgnify:CR=1 FL=1
MEGGEGGGGDLVDDLVGGVDVDDRRRVRVELGLLVDAVSEVIDISGDQIEPPPNFGASVRRDFIRGMGKVANRFVIILEPDEAFDVNEMAQLCEAAQEPLAA